MSPPLPKFDLFDEVRVSTPCASNSHLQARLGRIVGRTEDPGRRSWTYAVAFPDHPENMCFFESELEALGRQPARESFTDGTSAKVRIDTSERGPLAEAYEQETNRSPHDRGKAGTVDKWNPPREAEPDGEWMPWPGSEYDWTFPFKWLLIFCVLLPVLFLLALVFFVAVSGGGLQFK